MKTLHVITGLNVGGAETMLARLLEETRSLPDMAAEVVSLLPPGPAGDRIAALGIPVHHLGMRAGLPSIGALFRLLSIARRIRPDLIMGWMHHGQIAATIASIVAPGRPPVIWNVRHSLGSLAREKPLTRVLLRLQALISHTPRAIIYNSRAAAGQYTARGFDPQRGLVITNGFRLPAMVDREAAREAIRTRFGIDPEPLLIVMIARNHPMKDVPTLASAFRHVVAKGVDAHLLIVGHGMDRPDAAVSRLLAAVPRARWTLAGHRADVADWIGGADILALPSAWGEGFPNIIGEAMAAGVPCVATDVGDAGWLVGATGRIVPPREPVQLAHAILDLHRIGPAGRHHLGDAARARIARDFRLADVARDYAELCRIVADPPPAAGTALAPASGDRAL